MQIIVKSYSHVNRSLPNWDSPNGRIVKSKDHYERLCKENGMVSFERAEEMAKSKKSKDYHLSKESEDIIKYAHQIKDSKGNLKLGDVAIKKLIDKKAIGKKIPDYMSLPSAYSNKGGFS